MSDTPDASSPNSDPNSSSNKPDDPNFEIPDWLRLQKEDLKFIGDVAGYETNIVETDMVEEPDSILPTPDQINELLETIAKIIITEDIEEFCKFIEFNKPKIYEYAHYSEDVLRVVIDGYKMGVAQKNGTAANDFGAKYYMGELVEQDYKKAAELYEMAIAWGCDQSIINMGYIYEYGRIGKRDYEKAYEYYSLACALTGLSEAYYKLGDMYSRGKSVERDIAKAVRLWRKSLIEANNPIEVSQPAIRLAPLYLEGCEEANINSDPMMALRLYLDAEAGLRIDIDNGAVFYQKRLEEAIEGQQKARLLLDARSFVDSVFLD